MKFRTTTPAVILSAQLIVSSVFGSPISEGLLRNSAVSTSMVTAQKRHDEEVPDVLKHIPQRTASPPPQMLAQPRRTNPVVTNPTARSVLSGDIYGANSAVRGTPAATRLEAIEAVYRAVSDPASSERLAVAFRRFQGTSEFTTGSQNHADILMRFVNQMAGWPLNGPIARTIPSDKPAFANDLLFVVRDPGLGATTSGANHFRHPFFAHQDHDPSHQLITALAAASYRLEHPRSSPGPNTRPEWAH